MDSKLLNPIYFCGLDDLNQKEYIEEIVNNDNNSIFKKLIRIICRELEITSVQMFSKSRKHEFVLARHLFYFITLNFFNLNVTAINLFLGKKGSYPSDTMYHGARVIANYLIVDKNVKNILLNILSKTYNHEKDPIIDEKLELKADAIAQVYEKRKKEYREKIKFTRPQTHYKTKKTA
jgi:hypothetical protein